MGVGERGGTRRIWRAAVAVLGAAAALGCAARTPRIAGKAGAPPAPNRLWEPPPSAQRPDSLRPAAMPAGLAERAASLTLSDVVDLALQNNPATRTSWAQARAAADAYGSARGAYFPTVDGAVTAVRTTQPATATSASGGPTVLVENTRSSILPTLNVNYLLFDVGGRAGRVASARENAFALDFTHNATIRNTVLQVEQAYFTYVGTRALLEAQRQSVQDALTSYRAAAKRDSVGLATIADVLQARTALSQAQLDLVTTEGQLQTTRSALAVALGVSPTLPYDVSASADDIRVGEVADSVEALINLALRTRPELQAAYANAAAARAEVRVARSAALPSLAFTGTGGYTSSSVRSLTGRNYSIGIGLQLPIFNGGARQYDIARAQALSQAADAQAESVRQTVITDVFSSYYDVRTATQQVRTSDELLASATASLRAAQARYTGGVGSILDLITAQTALATARAQQVQARWVWALRLAQLARDAGALDVHGTANVPVTPDSTRSPNR